MLPEPPRNGAYMVAAYVVTSVILLGYVLLLWRHARRLLNDRSVRLSSTVRALGQ